MTVFAVDMTLECRRCHDSRPRVRWRRLLLVSIAALFSVGCNFPGQPDPADRPVPPDQILDFSTLYGKNCAGCHGADGTLGPGPPLNDPLFRAFIPEAELTAILNDGRKNTLMPAFSRENGGSLTAAQIQVLVYEIKGVPYRIVAKPQDAASVEVVSDAGGTSPKWGPPGEPPPAMTYSREPSTAADDDGTDEQVAGMAVFARACAICHGGDGEGIAQGDTLINPINDPVFLSLCSDQVLRRYVITGRSDLGMPGFADSRPDDSDFQPLTDEEVTAVVALLSSWRDPIVTGPQASPANKRN